MEYIIDSNGKKRKAVSVVCKYCDKRFLKPERFMKENNDNHFCCRQHANLYKSTKQKVICSVCDDEFYTNPARIKRSKSGLFFCSRKCKDEGQKITSGIKGVWPAHYGTSNGRWTYRKISIEHYGAICECCKYNEHIEILQVHHIDGNRENNSIENLIVLCPNCHALVTFGYAILENRIMNIRLHSSVA